MAMTEPAAPPEQQPPPDEPQEEDSALIPALLAIYALYLLWRGANTGFRGNALDVARALRLRETIGGALIGVAQRALADQRSAAGRAGDELWEHADAAARAGAEAGLQVLAEALLWTDSHTMGDPTTGDAGVVPGEAKVPTRSDPPTLLARMVAGATENAARLTAAGLAGWSLKIWQTRLDDRVRHAHMHLQGEVRPLGEGFETAGHKLMFPHDPSAPIELRAGCRCWLRFRR